MNVCDYDFYYHWELFLLNITSSTRRQYTFEVYIEKCEFWRVCGLKGIVLYVSITAHQLRL